MPAARTATCAWQSRQTATTTCASTITWGRAGETYVYRVEMTPVTPSLKLGIPRVDRYSQTRQTIVVPRGNRYGTLILATRADFGGPIELSSAGR